MSSPEDVHHKKIASFLQALYASKYVREDNVPCQIKEVILIWILFIYSILLFFSVVLIDRGLINFTFSAQGLFLGSVGVACNKEALKSLNVTHVLIVANSLEPAFPNDFIYKKIEGDPCFFCFCLYH